MRFELESWRSDDGGSVLLSVLLLSGIMAVLVLQGAQDAYRGVRLVADRLHAERIRGQLGVELGATHQRGEVQRGRMRGSLALWISEARQLFALPPGAVQPYRWELLLLDSERCPKGSKLSLPALSLGEPITPGSIVSSRFCYQLHTGDAPIRDGNVELQQWQQGEKQLVFGATGFISLGMAAFRRDAIVVAGGDLILQTLSAENSVHVTLVSLSGRVVLRAINGPLSFQIRSHHPVEHPLGIVVKERSVPLPDRRHLLLGLERS